MSLIGQLALMLLISKGHIDLQVQCSTGAVWVQPAGGKPSSLLSTLARNEELLAQVYLSQQGRHDPRAQLTDYFQKRGWDVRR